MRGLRCSVACEIFLDQDWTWVPCIGRQIPIHRTTREVFMMRILRGGAYPGLFEWVLKIITYILLREEKAMSRQRQRGEPCGFKPKNAGRHQKLGGRLAQILPSSLGRGTAQLTLSFNMTLALPQGDCSLVQGQRQTCDIQSEWWDTPWSHRSHGWPWWARVRWKPGQGACTQTMLAAVEGHFLECLSVITCFVDFNETNFF